MKIRLLLIIMMTGIFSCQSDPDNMVKKGELKEILSDYYNAMAKKDLPKMNALTTVNFVLFDEGMIFNNESAVKSVETHGSFTAKFTFDSLNIHFDKANASAYYFREAIFTIGDSTYMPMKFLESATFEKENGKWKLRFLHSSQRR